MIHNVLSRLRTELGVRIEPQEITIDNIAKGDNDDTAITDKVVITLLNVMEEAALRNVTRYEKVGNPADGPTGYKLHTPATYLNLFVMISANRSTYAQSLIDLSTVIDVFRSKNVLTYVDDDNETYTFTINLQPLPYEQLSYAWGLLGGKVMPSALYKISIVKIQTGLPDGAGVIGNINLKNIKSI